MSRMGRGRPPINCRAEAVLLGTALEGKARKAKERSWFTEGGSPPRLGPETPQDTDCTPHPLWSVPDNLFHQGWTAAERIETEVIGKTG